MNKKNGFILIEIIVSVMLLSIVGITLLKINSNEKNIFSIASKKNEFAKFISIIVNRHTINLHNKKINLYSFIKKQYNLKDKTLIKILKNRNIIYKEKYKSIVNFKTVENENSVNLLIDNISIANKFGTSNFITIKR